MTETIEERVQMLDLGEIIELFDLDLTAFGGQVYHFTPNVWKKNSIILAIDDEDELIETADGASLVDTHPNGRAVQWRGNTYDPVNVEAEGFDKDGRGGLPLPHIRITNAAKVFMAPILTYHDLVGATVTRWVTFSDFLDGEEFADGDAYRTKDVYLVERKVTLNKTVAEFELAASIDQEGKKLPGRVILKNTCTHSYRRYNPATGQFDYTNVSCPWQGVGGNPGTDGPYFSRIGTAISDISQDECGRRLSDCILRFNDSPATPQPLPTRAFPSVGQVR